mmetsp:Transcript_51997/g.144004  ORF Transcript_51997/g.144004 Transcript_51997/m.144004 type:complete len:207 (-) Transcript_51997:372-992(-)
MKARIGKRPRLLRAWELGEKPCTSGAPDRARLALSNITAATKGRADGAGCETGRPAAELAAARARLGLCHIGRGTPTGLGGSVPRARGRVDAGRSASPALGHATPRLGAKRTPARMRQLLCGMQCFLSSDVLVRVGDGGQVPGVLPAHRARQLRVRALPPPCVHADAVEDVAAIQAPRWLPVQNALQADDAGAALVARGRADLVNL